MIAVMTTALQSQNLGRQFIHRISRLAYSDELRLAHWRASAPRLRHLAGLDVLDRRYGAGRCARA